MNTLVILVGAPCSGKTTWAEDVMKDGNNYYVRIAEDDIISNLVYANRVPKDVVEAGQLAVDTLLASLADKHYDIILDSNYTALSRIDYIIDNWNKHYNIEYKIFSLSVETLVRRNELREDCYKNSPTEIQKQADRVGALKVSLNGYKGIRDYTIPMFLINDYYM